jgi:hypothetical protein
MEKVHILPTTKTPEILLNPTGLIKIKGRMIDESRSGVPEQLTSWIDEYILNTADSTEVVIALEFLNSFNTLILTSILKKIAQLMQARKKLAIRWYYEDDDVDIYDRGAYISTVIDVPIEFIMVNDVSEC